MNKFTRRILHTLSIIVLSFGSLIIIGTMPAYAATNGAQHCVSGGVSASKCDVCNGVALAGGDCNGGGADVSKVLTAVIDILSVIIGVAAVIMIIIAGLRYVTSAGDANHVSGAKNTLIYAIIGLIIVAAAQAIVKFVIGKTT